MANIDPPLLTAARTLIRKDDVIWGVGANLGLFSLAAAACAGDCGQVTPFEPDAWIAQLLRRTSGAQFACKCTANGSPYCGSIGYFAKVFLDLRFGREHPMPFRNTVAPKWVGWMNNI
jgi:hypothetical protein